jgi:hypothetical protein
VIAAPRPLAVIFDMDGVLLDSEPIGYEAMRQVMTAQGAPYDEAENDEFVGRTTTESFRILRERRSLRTGIEELVRQFCEAKIRLIHESARPLPGVPDVLERVRAAGYRLALASSAELPVIAATVDALGLMGCFELRVSGEEVPRGKPLPTSSSRRRGASPWRRGTAWWWRTRATGSSPPGRRACAARWCPARPPSATISRKPTTGSARFPICCRS